MSRKPTEKPGGFLWAFRERHNRLSREVEKARKQVERMTKQQKLPNVRLDVPLEFRKDWLAILRYLAEMRGASERASIVRICEAVASVWERYPCDPILYLQRVADPDLAECSIDLLGPRWHFAATSLEPAAGRIFDSLLTAALKLRDGGISAQKIVGAVAKVLQMTEEERKGDGRAGDDTGAAQGAGGDVEGRVVEATGTAPRGTQECDEQRTEPGV